MNRVFVLGAAVVPHLPRWFRGIISYVLAPFAYIFAAEDRRQAIVNASYVLAAASPGNRLNRVTRVRVHLVVVGMFRNSIANYVDLLSMPTVTPAEGLERIDGADSDIIDEALSHGKGAIVFGAHFGPIEQVGFWFSGHGYHVVIPVENLRNKDTLQATTNLRNITGAEYVPLSGIGGTRALIMALQRNQIVLVTADRAVGPARSVVRPFFGSLARLPIGPVDLAIRTGAPLIGGFCWRTSSQRTAMKFVRLTARLSPEERANPERVHEELVREIERVIAARPDQWVVFQPVWIEQPNGQATNAH